MVYSEKNIWHQNMYLLIFKSSVDYSAIWLPSLREAIIRPLRVPEGTRYPFFKITTRTLLEKIYYPAG